MMTNNVCRLTVANINLELRCDNLALAARLRQRYAAFVGQADPDLRVQIAWRKTAQQIAQQPMRQDILTGLLSSVYGFTFERGKLYFSAADYRGEIDLPALKAWLCLKTPLPLDGVEYFLRVIYALLLFEAGGVLLHGAGLVRDNLAYVLFGHSGSGKTTASRLSKDVIVLNDDLVALLPGSDGWVAYATPFWNPTQVAPVPHAAPLAGLYRLAQAQKVWLEPLTPAEAVAELASNVPVISADAARGAQLVERCSQLACQIGVKRLHFLKDDTFWGVLQGG